MSQRFAADQALQLLQSIALESSDGEYSDSKSDELNNVIADIQNSSDSDDKCTDQEVPINTNDGARAGNSCDNDEKNPFEQRRIPLRRSVSSQVTAGRHQQHNIVRIHARLHHIPHPTSYAAVLFLRSASFSTSPCLEIFRNALLQRHIVLLETTAGRLR